MDLVSRRTMLAAPCFGTLGIAVAAGATTATTPGALANLSTWMELASVPGASWAMLDGAGAISSGAVGCAKANAVPATPDTLFEAASLSKVVLAVAVHDMVRDKLIDLDRPVAKHVAFTDDAATRSITPRHLLSHSSGLPNWRDEAGEPLTAAFPPGTRFRYSGEGFALLGRLVEAVTGQTAAQVVETRVLRPAGMSRSTYGWARDTEPAVAWAHDGGGGVVIDKGPAGYTMRRDAGPLKPVDRWMLGERERAAVALGKPPMPIFMTPNMAAGLWTTASDYARFLAFAQRYPGLSTKTIRVKGTLDWGLGWGMESDGGRRFAWHWGTNDGVANLFVVDLVSGLAIVVLTNGDAGRKVYERAARTVFTREFDAFAWLK
ncbi:serine hydrolase domain-containing protein [Sphingomonas sp. CFBP 8765]|jgi:CubicO group peptidase (beta-lactamase class C family)|uniref:serine hydrolase domain-containing protein n=1 Tax=Sphingomonas sp. CFBP 8765 TaxID=2775274 RepID=UPI00178342DB|nr:serine hydrolase domain-containing protein [Sphingomonas sp. CFBP 8765]MBD8472421.1 beta-lactamase family protein [Sphingomonas sp. CFBP 8765]